ncbi:DUF4232 domain-containing protein [Streptomyces pinistramenti]|uniref:DUF4232 domain-containing protein n=1 Tax=Streptomyces pinistramenti TaxID=2884812 RepID=UPI001D06D29F|nr:DUF4232 domain-containing protein [Streptomyces pinistramenti]MCB5910987.1 DUF4232 domain-containing protein [Streptomyces pinistramenti]
MQIRRTLAFAAVAGATVFATAACGPDDTAASSGAGKSADSSASKGSDATGGDSGKTDAPAKKAESGTTGGNGGTSGGQGGSKAADATCSTDGTKIELVSAGGTLPAVVLKATNTAGNSCTIYGFPTLGYSGAQAAIGANEASKPQAAVTLDPGKSAYAALVLPKDGKNKHRETSLTVGLRGKDMGPVNGQATVKAPGVGLAISDATTVSYWQADQAAALQ